MTFLTKLTFVALFAFVASQDLNTCQPNLDYSSYAPDPDDCNYYNRCDHGTVALRRQCLTAGLKFDIFALICTSTNATCFPGLVPSCESIPDRAKVPSAALCSQYYNCENGGQLETCPDDLPYFHYQTMECRKDSPNLLCYPASSKDIAEPTTTPPTTTPQTEPPTTTPSEEPSIAPPTATPEVTDTDDPATPTTTPEVPETTTTEPPEITTTEPPITTTEIPPINTCLPNLAFTDYLPHPNDCSSRIRCQNGEPVEESFCPAGWNFDYVFLSCIGGGVANCYPGETISCATHSTPERHFLPHPKYCRQYYDCTALPVTAQKIGVACQEPNPFFDYRTMRCGSESSVLCYPGTSRDIPPPSDKSVIDIINYL